MSCEIHPEIHLEIYTAKIAMKRISFSSHHLKLWLSIGLLSSLMVPIALVSPSVTTIADAKSNAARKAKFRMPMIPKGDPPGGLTVGGGGRSDCPQVARPLTALMPTTSRQKATGRTVKDVWALTTVGAPKLWFYSPYAAGDRYPVELIIRQDTDRGKILARRSVAMPKQPGVFSVAMPETLANMQGNERRYWQLNLNCSRKPNAVPIQLAGMIHRVEMFRLQPIEAATTPHELAVEYADQGLWLEALDVLGQARMAEPDNLEIQQDWKDLLESVGLSAFTKD